MNFEVKKNKNNNNSIFYMYKPRIALILNVFVFKKVKPMYFYALGFFLQTI